MNTIDTTKQGVFAKPDKSVLNAAKMAEFIMAPASMSAEQLTQSVYATTEEYELAHQLRIRRRKKKDIPGFESAISAYLADLIKHSTNEASQGFFFRPANREQLAETRVSSTYFDHLTSTWRSMGLIEVTIYIQAKDDFDGVMVDHYVKARRLRASKALLEIANDHGIDGSNVSDHFRKQWNLAKPVVVKMDGGKRRKLSGTRTKDEKYNRSVDLVNELNEYLAGQSFSLLDTPTLSRVFSRGGSPSFDYDQGGRLYCVSEDNYQLKPAPERGNIRINGRRAIEIDVRASHLSIFYSLCGKKPPADLDPYYVPSVERSVVKKVIVTAFGKGKMPTQWMQGFADEYAKDTGRKLTREYKLNEVVSAILEAHPVLHRLHHPLLDWGRLQFEESEAFLSAMITLKRRYDVPALPVHDSLIVPDSAHQIARDVLATSYEKRFGFTPQITPEPLSADDVDF